MTFLRWVVLRPKTAVSYPWNDTGNLAAQRGAGADGRVAIGVYFQSGTGDGLIEHRLDFDPVTGREIT